MDTNFPYEMDTNFPNGKGLYTVITCHILMTRPLYGVCYVNQAPF